MTLAAYESKPVAHTTLESRCASLPGAVCCTVLLRCGDSSAEREFPSGKVYRRDDRGIIGVESLSLQGLAFFVIHTSVGRAACRAVPRTRNVRTG